jgi:hypothetical protein
MDFGSAIHEILQCGGYFKVKSVLNRYFVCIDVYLVFLVGGQGGNEVK